MYFDNPVQSLIPSSVLNCIWTKKRVILKGRKVSHKLKTTDFSYMYACIMMLIAYILLTHCLLMDSSTVICCRTSPFVIVGVSGVFCRCYSSFDGNSC